MDDYDEIIPINIFGDPKEYSEKKELIWDEATDAEDEENEARESLDGVIDLLHHMKNIGYEYDEDGDSDDNGMAASEYHNKADDCACRNKYKRATDLCIEGLKRYPMDVDLLADTIEYSNKSGNVKVAEMHYRMLRQLPFKCWNWRAFRLSCNYLLERGPVDNEAEIRLLVKQYKAILPHEENACMVESKLESALGNHEKSMKILADAIQKYSNASRCALRLADIQFERGMYAEVVRTCNYGIAASAEPQPSINIPYLLLLRVMSKDHLLLTKANHETVKGSEVKAIQDEYQSLLEEFPHQMMLYSGTIAERRSILKFVHYED